MGEKLPLISMDEGMKVIGMSRQGLRAEKFRTDGTSNYVVNLNYRGQTWAAALRLPARGASIDEFLKEKQRAGEASEYLIEVLKDGKDVGSYCTLKFEGVSCLVDSSSVQEYLNRQAKEKSLLLVDRITNQEKIIRGINYPDCLADDARDYVSSYSGPFYLSRGAPATETLENYPELEEPVAHALATLHLATGQGIPVSYKAALEILSETELALSQIADKWMPTEGSKEGRALKKSLEQWDTNDVPERARLIHRERFIRTTAGQSAFLERVDSALQKQSLPDHLLTTLSHGDCHGGNFILVRYQYVLNDPGVLLDREFLNDIFERNRALDQVAIIIDENNSCIVHDSISSSHSTSVVATRRFHHDIHIIDLDSVRGVTKDTKVLHLYDALLYSLSMANLTRLFGSPVESKEVLGHYYEGLRGSV